MDICDDESAASRRDKGLGGDGESSVRGAAFGGNNMRIHALAEQHQSPWTMDQADPPARLLHY